MGTIENNFSIGHLNVRSLLTHFDEFKTLVEQHNFDILLLSETWLNPGDNTEYFNIPNYNLIRRDRMGRGGGVAAYVKTDIATEIINFDFEVNAQLEYLVFKIKISNKKYAICVFYKPPKLNFNLLIPNFDNIFAYLYPTVDEIFCLGDFNINLINPQNPLVPLMENYNFSQIMDEPTRISGSVSSLIDAIFVTNNALVIKSGVMPTGNISDHKLIYCTLGLAKEVKVPKIIKHRSFRHFNFNNFSTDIKNLPWNDIFYENNIENKVIILNNLILTLFDYHAPIKESLITKPKAPWLTQDLKVFMKQRDEALTKFKNSKSQGDWVNYKNLRNFTLAAVRREKRKYLDSLAGNSKKTWAAFKNFNICTNKNNEIPHNLSEPNDINNHFSTYLQNKSNCTDKINFYANNFYNNNLRFDFKLSDTSTIHRILNGIKSNATGVDDISPLMLKYCSPYIDKYITHIINCCIENHYFPDQWKISVGRPLPKTSNPTSFNDLRIISILPALSKIFEKILYEQMYEYCINNNIIPNTQCGFRKSFGTSVALTNVLDDIFRACDKKMNSVLVTLDFSKAFDTVNHELLVTKLHYYGFGERSYMLINSYLTNRHQSIFCYNKFSDKSVITSGVPQGSVLGPLLFLIYTSDLLKSLAFCKVQAFADDTQIYICFDTDDYKEIEYCINEDLKNLCQFSEAHNLKLNPDKCRVMVFGNSIKAEFLKNNLHIVINNSDLIFVNSVKNLGVILDNQLRFKEHLKKLIQKAFFALKVLYNNKHILSYTHKKNLCETLVLSNFTYCDYVYGFCLSQECKDRIQKVQNACLRFIYGLRKFDHISHLYKNVGWLRMNERRILHFSTFLLNIINNPCAPGSLKERLIFRHTIHNINVRNTIKLTMPHHGTAIFQRSFSYNAVKQFNLIPRNFIGLSPQTFKKNFKVYLLNQGN